MPLDKGKSKKAFSKNVETEMNAGKPLKQSLAIAYSVKRKAKKMAKGGYVPDSRLQSDEHELDMVEQPMAHGGEMKSRKERALDAWHKKMAEGGQIEDNYESADTHINQTPDEHVDELAEPGHDEWNKSHPDHHNMAAMREDDRDLNQHGEEELGPEDGMAEGGQIEDNYQDPEGMASDDLVSRIMAQHMYSKGGQVANEDSGESASDPDQMAKDQPNEFDDLALRDDLEFSDTGANSGDELSDSREDSDRADIIRRVLASRKKKNKMPGTEKPGL